MYSVLKVVCYSFAGLASAKIFAILCSADLLYYMCKTLTETFQGTEGGKCFPPCPHATRGLHVGQTCLNACLPLLHKAHFSSIFIHDRLHKSGGNCTDSVPCAHLLSDIRCRVLVGA